MSILKMHIFIIFRKYDVLIGSFNASPCPHGNESSSYDMTIPGIMIRSTRLTWV